MFLLRASADGEFWFSTVRELKAIVSVCSLILLPGSPFVMVKAS